MDQNPSCVICGKREEKALLSEGSVGLGGQSSFPTAGRGWSVPNVGVEVWKLSVSLLSCLLSPLCLVLPRAPAPEGSREVSRVPADPSAERWLSSGDEERLNITCVTFACGAGWAAELQTPGEGWGGLGAAGGSGAAQLLGASLCAMGLVMFGEQRVGKRAAFSLSAGKPTWAAFHLHPFVQWGWGGFRPPGALCPAVIRESFTSRGLNERLLDLAVSPAGAACVASAGCLFPAGIVGQERGRITESLRSEKTPQTPRPTLVRPTVPKCRVPACWDTSGHGDSPPRCSWLLLGCSA